MSTAANSDGKELPPVAGAVPADDGAGAARESAPSAPAVPKRPPSRASLTSRGSVSDAHSATSPRKLSFKEVMDGMNGAGAVGGAGGPAGPAAPVVDDAGGGGVGSPPTSAPLPRVDDTTALRRVLIIYTGGTIGMKPSDRGYVCVARYLPETMSHLAMLHDPTFPVPPTTPPLARHASVKADAGADHPRGEVHGGAEAGFRLFCECDTMSEWMVTPPSEFGMRTLYRILEYWPLLDSSNMRAADWARIATDIYDYYDAYDAFVVLHGTDTMAYTSSALSFMLESLQKTVILTGSQIPLVRPRNDGLANLLGALNIAGHFDIPEVCVYFSNCLMRGNRTTKMHASDLAAFKTPNMRPLATAGISINVAWELVRRPRGNKLLLHPKFSDDIGVLRIYPGPFTTISNTLKPPLRGLVLQTFGAGNAPDHDPHLMKALKEATDRGVVIVNITQCGAGEVSSHYATGQALLDAGVIAGGDLTGEAALVKLGWLLGNYDDPVKVRKLMCQNLRGELTVSNTGGVTKFSLADAGFVKAVWKTVTTAERELHAMSLLGAEDEANRGYNVLDFINDALMPTLMCSAASTGLAADLKDMIEESAADVSNGDYDGRTALHLAACGGHTEIVELLIAKGADVNTCDRFGGRPLDDAVTNSHRAVIDLLVAASATLGAEGEALASKLCTCAQRGNVTALELYAAAGADMSAADYNKRTALHTAVSAQQVEAVEALIRCGANVNAVDVFNNTPIREAIKLKATAIVKALRGAGAELGLDEPRLAAALCNAATAGDAEQLELYADAGANVSACDYDRRTALHVAVADGKASCVRVLVRHGADVHAEDRWGATPLSDAQSKQALLAIMTEPR